MTCHAGHRSMTSMGHAAKTDKPKEHVRFQCTHTHSHTHTHICKQEHAVLQCHAGVSEGRPRNIVQGVVGQPGADHWFSTNESAHPAPWVELHLPHNMRLLSLQHYTFTHGHHRSSYFRCAATQSLQQFGSSYLLHLALHVNVSSTLSSAKLT